jgi:branched-subunit amino acid aminotransferase/4-amino-4-deoxychorismate lyase
MTGRVYTQGHWQPVDSLPVHPAHTIYTTLKWPVGSGCIDLHYARLTQDGQWLGCQFPLTLPELLTRLDQLPTLAMDQWEAWRVRVTVYPDGAVIMQAVPLIHPPNSLLKVKTVAYRRPTPLIKHGDLMPCTKLTEAAKAEGFDEVVLVNTYGELTEGAFAALAVWAGNAWCFPHPLLQHGLPSLTAYHMQRWLTRQGIPWHYQGITASAVKGLVLLSAIRGVSVVHQLNNRVLAPIPASVMPWLVDG